jgi:hypothetical protein
MAVQKYINIIHPKFGELVQETFIDEVQFRLFLQLVHSCIELGQDLTSFNARDFLIHIPHSLLKESIVIGNTKELSLGEYAVRKSKMEG